MFAYILYGLIAGIVAVLSHIDFQDIGRSLGRGIIYGTITAFLFGVFSWIATPLMYGPFWGMSMAIFVSITVNVAIAGIVHKKDLPDGVWILLLFFCAVFMRGCGGSAIWHAEDYRDFIGEVEKRDWSEEMQPIDPTHVRTVSQLQAEWLGDKAIGQVKGNLGSKFEVGEYSIQRVSGELNWVAPLAYRGFSKWTGNDHVPGFVMVSAEDRNRGAELITDEDIRMKYMPSAFFGTDLKRHLYTNGYNTKALTEYSFELDDDMNPYWVISVYELTIHYDGPKVTGVLIVDPETGDISFHEVGNVPEWVDRVYPEWITKRYAQWNGQYVQGWLNSWWGEDNVEVPTEYDSSGSDMTLVYGSGSQPMWFTGLTSPSSSDQSLTATMMVDSRTGQAYKYDISGVDESGVIDAVNSSVSNYQGYKGTQPIPYNVYGMFTWAVPVVSEKNIFQKMALVNASNATVQIGDDVTEVLRKYRNALPRDGFSEAMTDNSAINRDRISVDRVNQEQHGQNTLYFVFSQDVPNRVFSGRSSVSPELSITQPGDSALVVYRESGEAEVSLDEFDNLDLNLRTLENQEALTQRRDSVSRQIQDRENAEVLEEEIDDLSPEQRSRMMEVLRDTTQ